MSDSDSDHKETDDVEITPKKTKKVTKKKEVVSYAHIRGEWEERKISVFGAVKSFIGQLRAGQDLTRVSLPCVFQRPYSLLEEVGARNLKHIDLTFTMSTEKDPLQRMLALCNWLLSTTSQEKMNHKPFNPLIGEVHRAKVVHDVNNPLNTTYLIVEQVCHHPPICGVRIDNPYHKLSVQGHHTFEAQFNKNSVSIMNHGKTEIQLGDETYLMSKAMPNLVIKNCIIGTKHVVWEGLIGISCKESGYHGTFDLTTKSSANVVSGPMYNSDSAEIPYLEVSGKCGGPASYHFNPKHPQFKDKDKKEQKELKKEITFVLAPEKKTPIIPTYPQSQEKNSSITIWEDVRQCILANDMEKGDELKCKIEDDQRKKFAALKEKGEEWEPVFFAEDKETGIWKIKNTEWWKDYKD